MNKAIKIDTLRRIYRDKRGLINDDMAPRFEYAGVTERQLEAFLGNYIGVDGLAMEILDVVTRYLRNEIRRNNYDAGLRDSAKLLDGYLSD